MIAMDGREMGAMNKNESSHRLLFEKFRVITKETTPECVSVPLKRIKQIISMQMFCGV